MTDAVITPGAQPSLGDALERPTVRLLRLPHAADIPRYATSGAAGADLVAAPSANAPIELAPGAFAAIPTGVALALPEGWEAQVRPRSGLAARHGVCILNAPGTIDWDYRGEISVLLINHGPEAFLVERGMRIAQLVLARAAKAVFDEATALDDTPRGDGGFGSTGGIELGSERRPAQRQARGEKDEAS